MRHADEVIREPPPGTTGLAFPCASCEEEIVVYYLHPGERAQCGECGETTFVPEQAEETDKPSTLARAYGYGDPRPAELRSLPQPAERPNDVDALPRVPQQQDVEDDSTVEKLPKRTKQKQ